VHPSLASVQPGDLVFWSKDGTINGIGHVAVYVGNGYVVQAPRSGARIQVTPLDMVEPGRIGVTRPLT
jgi:cell wall-associated NlpC family hydrolase